MGLFGGFLGGKKKKDRSRRSAPKGKMPRPGAVPKPSDTDEAEDASSPGSGEAEDELDLSAIEKDPALPPKPAVQPRKPEGEASGEAPRLDSHSTVIIPPKRKAPGEGQKIPSGRFRKKSATSSSARRKRTSIAKKRLGNLLVSANIINENQLQKALETQEKQGGLIGQILVDMGVCNTGNVGAALNKQRTITTVELENVAFDPEAIAMVTRDQCEKYRMIPFQKIGPLLCLAMSNVLDSTAKNEVRDATQAKLKTFDASWSEIAEAIETHYPKEDSGADAGAAGASSGSGQKADIDFSSDDGLDDLVIELPDENEEPAPQAADASAEAQESQAPVIEEAGAGTAPPTEKPEKSESGPTLSSKPGAPASAPQIRKPEKPAPSIVSASEKDSAAKPANRPLAAIPVPRTYFEHVTEGGRFSIKRRWMADRSLNGPIAARPEIGNGQGSGPKG